MVKIWFKNKIDKVITKIKRHFDFENLIYNFFDLVTINFIISVGIDEIYFGTKNLKRFKLCILICIINWFVLFYHFLFLNSDFIYSLIESPFLPDDFNVIIIILILALFPASIFKTDMIFGEINYNLNQLKIYYFLAKDIKSKHKLSEQNYNRLVFLFRICYVILLYYGLPIMIFVVILFQLMSFIKTKQLFVLVHFIFITPIYINVMIVLIGTLFGVCFILYCKMRFDQLHHQIKSIIPNGKWKFITKRKGKLLLDLIDEHNQLAIQVHKFNMTLRRTLGSMFIDASLMKIVTLHIILNSKNTIFKFLTFNIFAFHLVFGFAAGYILSQQIKSAHQSLKFFHFVVCKYKMKLPLRLKVKIM